MDAPTMGWRPTPEDRERMERLRERWGLGSAGAVIRRALEVAELSELRLAERARRRA